MANSATMRKLVNPCNNPTALARVPEGIASQSIKPNTAATSPPITPAAIVQNEITAHRPLPVIK